MVTCKDCVRYQSGRCAMSDEDNDVCSRFELKGVSMFLRSCPFCGKSVATFVTAREEEECKHFEDDVCPVYEPDECGVKKIVCDFTQGGCGASTGYASSEERAIELWNRRKGE